MASLVESMKKCQKLGNGKILCYHQHAVDLLLVSQFLYWVVYKVSNIQCSVNRVCWVSPILFQFSFEFCLETVKESWIFGFDLQLHPRVLTHLNANLLFVHNLISKAICSECTYFCLRLGFLEKEINNNHKTFHVLKMKAHFENESTYWKWKHILKAQFEKWKLILKPILKMKTCLWKNKFVYNCVFQLNLFDLIPQDLYW